MNFTPGGNNYEVVGEIVSMSLPGGHRLRFDLADLWLVRDFHWMPIRRGATHYAVAHSPVSLRGRGTPKKTILMHRLIFAGAFDGIVAVGVVDHINLDPLDNRRFNLRLCSVAQNVRNQGLSRRSTTGFKGVSFDKARSAYSAQIGFKSGVHHLGRFPSPLAAALAYDEAAIRLHGEFAKTNFSLGLLPTKDSA